MDDAGLKQKFRNRKKTNEASIVSVLSDAGCNALWRPSKIEVPGALDWGDAALFFGPAEFVVVGYIDGDMLVCDTIKMMERGHSISLKWNNSADWAGCMDYKNL